MAFKVKENQKPSEPELKIDRLVPIDSNNEQFLLGHAIHNQDARTLLVSEVDSDEFLFMNHKVMFDCVQYLADENIPINIDSLDSVKTRFENGEKLNIRYMNELVGTFIYPEYKKDFLVEYKLHIDKLHTDKIKDNLQLKLLPDLAKELVRPQVTIEQLVEQLDHIRTEVERGSSSQSFKFVHASIVDTKHSEIIKARETDGTFGTTGYDKLDKVMTDGFAPRKITITAGRPGMAKSALVANLHLRIGMLGIPNAIYTFEMEDVSMYDRMIALYANLPLINIIKTRNLLTPEERKREADAKDLIRTLPIYFYTASTQTMQGAQRDITKLRDQYGVRFLSYDLFKKMQLRARYNSSTADVLSENLDKIQSMGKDLNIHQNLVVQIGRAAEKRKDKRPLLQHLKDSGGFEEVADNVLLLYRPAYYQRAEDTEEEEVALDTMQDLEIIIAKQRQGKANQKVMLHFFPANTCIAEPILEIS